ncbi:uncharacterized protein LOC144632978 [Oculina patagonica]
MRTSVILAFCVLSCFCSKFADCKVVGQKGTSLNSRNCLDISMQVEKASEDIKMVTEKIKAYYVSHEILASKEKFITGIDNPSRYSIGLHIRSVNMRVTLNVAEVKCETYNRTGRSKDGKILTTKDGIQISLEYNSSVADSGADTTTALDWIMWPFKSLANKMAIVYNFWAEKVMKVLHWIAWPFKSLANKIVAAYNFVAGVCSSLKKQVNKQFDDPIKLIEAVLEVIWMMVSPVIRAVIWLCEIIIDVKRDIKLKTALFLEEYPAVLGYIETCKTIGEHLSKLMALWPLNWMDSIECIGYTWVILYFSFALMKFAMMDERQMIRMARHADRNSKRH